MLAQECPWILLMVLLLLCLGMSRRRAGRGGAYFRLLDHLPIHASPHAFISICQWNYSPILFWAVG